MKAITQVKEQITNRRGADETFVHFIVLLYCIATGEVSPQQVFQVGGKTGYGTYSKAFWKVFIFGVDWRYGLAKASELVSSQFTKSNPHLGRFLLRLGQVIRLGDSLSDYFKTEMELVLQNYYTTYQRNIESLKMILGMYSAIMSITAFMVSALTIINMLTGDSSNIMFVGSVVGVVLALAMFVLVMYVIFPRDVLIVNNSEDVHKLNKWVYLSIAAGTAIAAVSFLVESLPTFLGFVAVGVPFIIAGQLAKRIENSVRRTDEWYPPFAKDFGTVFHTVGSVRESLRALMRSDFDAITPHIRKLLHRSLNKVPPPLAFDLFSKESNSQMIKSGNTILAHSIIKGSNMADVGHALNSVLIRINELRKLRDQATRSFLTMIFILHVLTLVVFSFMTRLSFIFTDLFSQMEGAGSVFSFQPMDPGLITTALPLVLVGFSAVNAFAIKVGEGGFYKTAFYHFGVLLMIGGFSLFGADYILTYIVSNQNIDLSQLT